MRSKIKISLLEDEKLPLNFTGNSYGLYKVNTCLWVDWSSMQNVMLCGNTKIGNFRGVAANVDIVLPCFQATHTPAKIQYRQTDIRQFMHLPALFYKIAIAEATFISNAITKCIYFYNLIPTYDSCVVYRERRGANYRIACRGNATYPPISRL